MSRQGIMLCYPFEEKRLAKWPKPWLVQPKLDGDRCRAVIDSLGNAWLYSSEGNIIESAPHIVEQLEDLHLQDIEFDGELYIHHALHQDIHSIASRTTNLHSDFRSLEYHIFDIVSNQPQWDRIYRLGREEEIFKNSDLKLVPSYLAFNLEEIMSFAENFKQDNYEGFVIRHYQAPYVRKRTTTMMKFKPRRYDYYTVVGYKEELSEGGIPKGTLGALECIADQLSTESFRVGTGFTDELRAALWQVRETLPGQICRVAYQTLTRRGVPWFPVFVELVDCMGEEEEDV